MTTTYNIHELKIRIRSNILKSNGAEYENFEFTKNNLHLKDQKKFNKTLNTYPYFTYQFEYPRDKLLSLSMRKRIEFFFNLEQFVLYLTTFAKKPSSPEDTKIKLEVSNHNVRTMLELLFPTQFPIHNDIKDSYTYYIKGDRRIRKQMWSMATHPFENKYSYLKHNGKVYTTRRVIWINDMVNHSLYGKLINAWISKHNIPDVNNKPNEKTVRMLDNTIKNVLRTIIRNSKSSISYISLNDVFQNNIDRIDRDKEKKFLVYIQNSFMKRGITENSNIEDNTDNTNIQTSILKQITSTQTYYYIELSVDYFQGEINSENKSKFICNFTSNHLGELFEKIVQSKKIDQNKQKWNVEQDKAPLYQSDVPIVTKRNNTIKLEENQKNDNRDNRDNKREQLELFNDIIQNGTYTLKYIEELIESQGQSIELEQIYEEVYLDTLREMKLTNVVEKIYKILTEEENINPTFLIQNVKKIKSLQRIKIQDKEAYKKDPIETISRLADNDPVRILMYFLMEDIVEYMSARGMLGDVKKGGESKTRKNKKQAKNATIKKN